MSYRRWVAEGRPRNSDNPFFIVYKADKKAFHVAIKSISKDYEDKEVLEAVKSAEFNRNSFWKLVRTARKNRVEGVNAVRRADKVVVHEQDEVLKVWADHFTNIGTPKKAKNYDNAHFLSVTKKVASYNVMDDGDMFLDSQFTLDEVIKAIKTLHLGKAPGFDNIMSEHLVYAGPAWQTCFVNSITLSLIPSISRLVSGVEYRSLFIRAKILVYWTLTIIEG